MTSIDDVLKWAEVEQLDSGTDVDTTNMGVDYAAGYNDGLKDMSFRLSILRAKELDDVL